MKRYEVNTPERSGKGLTRRKFVETTAIAGATVAAVPFLGGQAPAYAQARKVHYLQWTSFIPEADAEIDRQAEEFTKATGIEMTVETRELTPELWPALERLLLEKWGGPLRAPSVETKGVSA